MGKRIIKKFIICLLVAAVALGSVFAVAGCNLIVENEYRTANQVLATVKGVNGIKLTVTQNEIMDYYNTYGPYLTNPNYGYNYTVEEAFEWCLENKIKSKYLITAAMVYLYQHEHAQRFHTGPPERKDVPEQPHKARGRPHTRRVLRGRVFDQKSLSSLRSRASPNRPTRISF